MSFVGDVFDGITGRSASRDARRAADRSVAFQYDALDYIQEKEEEPLHYRDEALGMLAGFYGIPGFEGQSTINKEGYINNLKNDPLYQQLLKEGEQAIMRNASATGGMRSGNVNENLADNSYNLLRAFYNDNVQGLKGLAGIPTNTSEVAESIRQIGATEAQGITAAANAEQQGWGNLVNIGLGLASFCDRRLKSNVEKIGSVAGVNWYRWEWNEHASELGLSGVGEGPMADEVQAVRPDLVYEHESGYLMVKLGELVNE